MSEIRYAYVIAFRGDEFLMVRHARRAWEMPGGKVEKDELPEDAAIREFREETGYDVESLHAIEVEDGGIIYIGDVGQKVSVTPDAKEIADVRFFSELPEELSFPLVEYRRMINAAYRFRRHQRLKKSS